MKKPRICFVTSFFCPTIGGVETHIYNLSKELIKLGYDVDVYVSDMDRDQRINEKTAEIDGIKVRRFKSWFKFSFSGIFFPGLFRGVKNSNADIFHVHGYRHPFNFIFWFTKKPCFLTPHWPVYKGQRDKFVQVIVDLVDRFFGKYIFKKFSKICVVTELESSWVKSFGVKEKDIILTPNCLPEEYFKEYDGSNFRKKYNLKKELVVLSVSRLHKSKGTDQLVKIAKFFPKIRFIIMGKDGGFRKELENLIKKFNLHNIILTGEVTEKEKLEAYAGSDIFCSPSHYEGFCISILEAMSQGCAVITSNQGGMPWVVGDAGLIFEDYNLEDFRKKLEMLINNRKLLEKFKSAGKKKIKNFKWERVANTLDKEYKVHIDKT
ncbi:MAG: glycosyltransferase family 4 protein [Nanoarchaeota archaeon]|nr:glycosyltransferase family 4 protein [Nanoarchaeota archaeon]